MLQLVSRGSERRLRLGSFPSSTLSSIVTEQEESAGITDDHVVADIASLTDMPKTGVLHRGRYRILAIPAIVAVVPVAVTSQRVTTRMLPASSIATPEGPYGCSIDRRSVAASAETDLTAWNQGSGGGSRTT